MDQLQDTEEMAAVSSAETLTKVTEPSTAGDPVGDLMAKLFRVEKQLKDTQEALEKELRRNKLPAANEFNDMKKRLAELEGQAGEDRPTPEKTGPECLFGWYPRFDEEAGREKAAADIAKHEADGWKIAHEEYRETIYIVRFTRGKRNNPYGTPLVERRDRDEMNWEGITAAQTAYQRAEGRRREKPPVVIQGTLVSGMVRDE